MERRPRAIARWWMLLVLGAVPLHLSFAQEGQPSCEGAYRSYGGYPLRGYYLLCEADGTELRIRLSLDKSHRPPWSGRLDLQVTNRDAESFDFVPDRDLVISAEFTGRKEKECGVRFLTVEEQEQRLRDYVTEAAKHRALLWSYELSYRESMGEDAIWTDVGELDEAEAERTDRRFVELGIAAIKQRALSAHTLSAGEGTGGVMMFDLPHRKCAITSIAIQVGTVRYVFDPKKLRKR